MVCKGASAEPTTRRRVMITLCLLFLLALSAFLALLCGQYSVSFMETVSALCPWLLPGVEVTDTAQRVVWNMRMPRIILAILTGAGLGMSGAAFQGLFSNPLATPDTLGVAAGASFGAALGILLGLDGAAIQLMAFGLGLAAVAAVYLIGGTRKDGSLVMIVLSGLVVSALFQALVSGVKYIADPQDQLPAITFWLMGSLSTASYKEVRIGAPLILAGMLALFLLRWRINALTLQEDEARALGIPVRKLRALVILASTLVTASVVSMCGQVSWVGLLVPHVARMLLGNNHRHVVPACFFIGAIFMILIDTLARTLTAAEIPISILTAVIGAPMFIVLLRRTGGLRE